MSFPLQMICSSNHFLLSPSSACHYLHLCGDNWICPLELLQWHRFQFLTEFQQNTICWSDLLYDSEWGAWQSAEHLLLLELKCLCACRRLWLRLQLWLLCIRSQRHLAWTKRKKLQSVMQLISQLHQMTFHIWKCYAIIV